MQHEPNARVPAGPDPAIRALLSRDDEEAERAAQQNERLAGLLLRTAERDQQAFAAFYDETFKQAFAVARRIVLSTESAEDVLEDAYFQVWREAARFDGGRGRALTWLLMMVRSRALDHLRRRDPVQSLEQAEHRLGSSDGGEYIDTQAGHEGYPGNPHDLLDATRRESAIHTALAALRPVERQIIALAYFRDLSHQEIATTCRMPLGSVKTIIHRAHGKLRTILAAHGIEA